MGKAIIMGRKTHESIGRPLPGRRTIVVSRRRDLRIDGCEVVNDTADALALVEGDEEAMVIGGEQIYRQLLARCDRIYLTRVKVDIEGDAVFPVPDSAEWQVVASESFPPREGRPAFTFTTLERPTAR